MLLRLYYRYFQNVMRNRLAELHTQLLITTDNVLAKIFEKENIFQSIPVNYKKYGHTLKYEEW